MAEPDELRDPRPDAYRRDAIATGRDEVAEHRDEDSAVRDGDAGARDQLARRRDARMAAQLHQLTERLSALRAEILDRLDRIDGVAPARHLPLESEGTSPEGEQDPRRALEDRNALEALLDEIIAVLTRQAAVLGAAAGDRRASSRDRLAAAEDRRSSAEDRDRSAADREEAAIDRERIDFRLDLPFVRQQAEKSRASYARHADVVGRVLAETRERISASRRLLATLTERNKALRER
ncbi:hypothetical protein ACQP04_11000 [Pseudonocardia halophobica]|uniref:hypothetical protein n=1 Tax=Pseudonocardia halophobica TaxID=29401 RepID=UPI003D8D6A6F